MEETNHIQRLPSTTSNFMIMPRKGGVRVNVAAQSMPYRLGRPSDCTMLKIIECESLNEPVLCFHSILNLNKFVAKVIQSYKSMFNVMVESKFHGESNERPLL